MPPGFPNFHCHFTFSEGHNYSSQIPTNLDNDFTLVGDTGSSFNMTPFVEDINHIQAKGKLGRVITAEGRPMPMTLFGHAEYFAVNTKGKWVPFYPLVFVVEGVTQRLISPQDLSNQFGLDPNQDSYGGLSRYFWMDVGGNRLLTHVNGANGIPFFNVRRRLPSDPPRTFVPPKVKLIRHEKKCDCTSDRCTCQRENRMNESPQPLLQNVSNVSVLEEVNQNLTPTQKAILLWHCRLGHVGFQLSNSARVLTFGCNL
jgi:hypothetical protein